jgi:RES domain-containing protein
MIVYRIVKGKNRTRDLTGMGAFLAGGRWNHEGSFGLYTSENPSLALLELLVHNGSSELPPRMFLMTIAVDDDVPIYEIKEKELPKDWRTPDHIALKELGDKILSTGKFIGIRARSAVLPIQYNFIINPKYKDYNKKVRVIKVEPLDLDQRF